MTAVTASVLGGSLLAASEAPFDRAFAGQHGAHLTAQFDAARTTAEQLSKSAHAAGVTAASGPFRTTTVDPHGGPEAGLPADVHLSPMTVVGRADPGGPVDDVTLVQGAWASGPGQVVLSTGYEIPGGRLGTVLRFPGLPGDPALSVVGFARSVSRTADAWVAPSQITSLTPPDGTGAGYQMLYRFTAADTTAQLADDRAAVRTATPAGALLGSQSWLVTRQGSDHNTALFVPFLIAFGLLGLLMSVLVVGNVVAGAVGAGTRRIGILKALGFTPARIVRSYMGQALIPAVVGVALGAVAGNALSVPVLSVTAEVYGTTTSGVAPWVDLSVIAGALGVVTVTAWAAALRAGRLRTVDALAVGRTPRPGRGRRAARLTARLHLPRPVGLGLAHAFARPARAAAMVAAVVFGTASTTFAVGMGSTLDWVQAAKNHGTADVVVHAYGPAPGPAHPGQPTGTPATGPAVIDPAVIDPAAITAVVNARPGVEKYYAVTDTDVTVAGVSGATTIFAFTGDASWAGYRMVSGTWFHHPGEAVAPATFLTAAGARIGDTVTVNARGKTVPVRIVGEVFDPHTQTDELLTDTATLDGAKLDTATLTGAKSDPHPASYYLKLKPGTDAADFIRRLDTALAPLGGSAESGRAQGSSDVILALDTLTGVLTLLLVSVACLGILNSVVLQTRERVRDIGIGKALGMTPRQTISMVLSSVTVIGLAGGAIGLPLGLALHHVTVPAMARSAGLRFPAPALDVYPDPELLALALGGPLIAVLGALLPAGWAARTRTATALRTE
ncbi:ABC transporter permease [Kitasatospora sp. HPMI-4]|uniref:ABC transporter permease n=1 Tax=Kitasatospora sp. HPMI-4 TaxID=3448443 RepID=UPI003F1BEF71